MFQQFPIESNETFFGTLYFLISNMKKVEMTTGDLHLVAMLLGLGHANNTQKVKIRDV